MSGALPAHTSARLDECVFESQCRVCAYVAKHVRDDTEEVAAATPLL